MSDANSAQEKTEEASAQKLKKSREQGQVARSKDIATAVTLIAGLLTLKACSGFYLASLAESFHRCYPNLEHSHWYTEDLPDLVGEQILLLAKLMLPLFAGSVLVIISSLVPGGWTFASKNFTPQFNRLNPISGLAKLVSAQNWTELLKSLFKVMVLGLIGWCLAVDTCQRLIAAQELDLASALSQSFNLIFNTALGLIGVFIVFALVDIPLQRFFFLKKMRMTKQERKEEHKNQEGRPEVKARIKQLQRQLLQRQIGRAIKDADVVIANPQHYAVALKYDPKKAKAPFVLAKGVDDMALYIKTLAAKHQLEVLEIPPLARAIYFTTSINQQIPSALYTAVAHVLTYILHLRAWRQGRRAKPTLATNLPVPAAMADGTAKGTNA